jgi:diaminohydroxyphosphoribosylaminopyrimidine deaminase/5-amino-6-(5-phosphoribosylamino)uracil reductase
VGCVIALDGQVIGRGWHKKAGQSHAEIIALQDAGEQARDGTAYVTLEPCSHVGRTPPCVEALIRAKIARVVFAVEDPNPEVNGRGFQRLQQAGIEVQSGLMIGQAEDLNRGFLKRMRQQLPWVRIKLAQSMDGHTALANGSSKWISGPESRTDVQHWRARSDAILTGIGTVLADDPSLNVRTGINARQPARIVVDSHWRTPANARLLGLPGDTLIAGLDGTPVPENLKKKAAECIILPERNGRVNLQNLLHELGKRGFNEIQVESGAILSGSLVQQGLVDEFLIYQSPAILGGGAISPFALPRLDKMDDRVHLQWIDSRLIGKDLRLRLKPEYDSE